MTLNNSERILATILVANGVKIKEIAASSFEDAMEVILGGYIPLGFIEEFHTICKRGKYLFQPDLYGSVESLKEDVRTYCTYVRLLIKVKEEIERLKNL